MRKIGVGLAVSVALGAMACGGGAGQPEAVASTAQAESTAIQYKCVPTGTDPMGAPIWFELEGTVATLSHDAKFGSPSTGTFDSSYKPPLRVNTDRYIGFSGWSTKGTTSLIVDKSLEVAGGSGLLFVDIATPARKEKQFSCTSLTPAPDAGIDAGPVCPSPGYTGVIATYDMAGQPGTELSVAVNSTGPGIGGGDLTRSSALVYEGGANSINSKEWSEGASADPTRYYTFTVTPPPGCTLGLASLTLDSLASSTGPSAVDLATSADGFASHTPLGMAASNALSGASDGALEIRIYGYGAKSLGGTYRIQDTMQLLGTLE